MDCAGNEHLIAFEARLTTRPPGTPGHETVVAAYNEDDCRATLRCGTAGAAAAELAGRWVRTCAPPP